MTYKIIRWNDSLQNKKMHWPAQTQKLFQWCGAGWRWRFTFMNFFFGECSPYVRKSTLRFLKNLIFHIIKWHFSQSTFWTHLLWFVVTNYKYGKLMILIRASEKWSRYLSYWIILTSLVFSVSLLFYASTCFILEVLNTKCVSSFANMMHLFLFQTYL